MSQINPKWIVERGILIVGEHSKIQQVGIDLTIRKTVHLADLEAKSVNMNEAVKLPNDIFALFIHRSSFNRKGVLITGSVYDPGYQGIVGCTVYNMSGANIKIHQNERIGQMVFFKADAASVYNGKYLGEGLE